MTDFAISHVVHPCFSFTLTFSLLIFLFLSIWYLSLFTIFALTQTSSWWALIIIFLLSIPRATDTDRSYYLMMKGEIAKNLQGLVMSYHLSVWCVPNGQTCVTGAPVNHQNISSKTSSETHLIESISFSTFWPSALILRMGSVKKYLSRYEYQCQ